MFFHWTCGPCFSPLLHHCWLNTGEPDTSVALIAIAVGNMCPHIQWKNTISWFIVHWIYLALTNFIINVYFTAFSDIIGNQFRSWLIDWFPFLVIVMPIFSMRLAQQYPSTITLIFLYQKRYCGVTSPTSG